MFPLNFNKYPVTSLYKTGTNFVFVTCTLIDPLGKGNDFILRSVKIYSDRLLVKKNITNLEIFG